MRQAKTGSPSMSTVHAPHSPSSHPCLVPVSFKSSRKTSSNVLCVDVQTSCNSPLIFKVSNCFIFPLYVCFQPLSYDDFSQKFFSCFYRQNNCDYLVKYQKSIIYYFYHLDKYFYISAVAYAIFSLYPNDTVINLYSRESFLVK